MITQPISRLMIAEEWTVSPSARLSFAPKQAAVSTLMPSAIPMRMPVKSTVSVEVEPTEPSASGPAKRPTTAISAMLNITCSRLEKIKGRLNRTI